MPVQAKDLWSLALDHLQRDPEDLPTSQLDKATPIRRLGDMAQDLLSAPGLRDKAEQNWYIVYGEPLPV